MFYLETRVNNNVTPIVKIFNANGVEFKYPPLYIIQPAPESNLVMSSWGGNSGYGVSKVSRTKTGHFTLESIFTISKAQFYSKTKSSLDIQTKCFTSENDPQIQFNDAVTINKVVFKKSQPFGAAAAGNQYHQQAFRTMHDDYCWNITLTNHSSSDWNEVDSNEAKNLEDSSWKELNQILSTFRFTKS